MAPDQASPGQPATAAPAEAIRHPLVQFARLLASDAPPFRTEVAPGYKRGIDFYPTVAMPRVLHSAAMQFRKVHGRFPDLIQPRRLSDKIFWSKFFRPLKVPETGNKLLTSSFIPEEAKKLVRCPEIVWHSPAPPIPRNAAV